ncbi:DNA-directed RNA polymerase I subunit RPA43 [Lepeophtheirus salmonis]|uniref:DNA-directed RNA polymerase I subunit RPA43 n=1 Tax=Lepeophtheirus salmonis TaxID=72036 RepID=UPI001AE4843B|nr:DNA-directed RNA polymerase I subunit RPA43-like [Lepeophtheirus salmonis]
MPKGMLPRETLRQLQDVPDSAVIKVTQNMHMAIHPQYLGNIQLGIINYFNSEITHFNSKLDGVLLGYGKIRLKEPKAEVLNEEHYLHLDVHSDFWVFRPQIDSILAGVVNTKSSAHVSVLIHGLFNVPCHKNLGLEKDEWIGTGVQVGEHVRVRIVRMDLNQKIPFLMGELLETTPKVNVKEEPMELILVENIKEEKVWDDITAGNEDSDMDNGEEEELASTQKKKKKKKNLK